MVTPYNKDFVLWLKGIDKYERSWDPEAKIWYFSPKITPNVRKRIEEVFGHCDFTDRKQVVVDTGGGNHFATFCRLVGAEDLTAAYKRAAVRLHPDRGGDPQKMAELNAAWQKVKEAL